MKDEKDIFDFLEKRKVETPDADYFEQLAKKAIAVANSETTEVKIIPLYKRPLLWISSAAAAIIIAVILLPEEASLPKTPSLAMQDLSKKEVLAYVNDNIDEFDEELLIEFIKEEHISTPQIPLEPETETPVIKEIQPSSDFNKTLESISKDEILDYLNEESLDIMDLEDDLF